MAVPSIDQKDAQVQGEKIFSTLILKETSRALSVFYRISAHKEKKSEPIAAITKFFVNMSQT